jgi:hypothetical protein
VWRNTAVLILTARSSRGWTFEDLRDLRLERLRVRRLSRRNPTDSALEFLLQDLELQDQHFLRPAELSLSPSGGGLDGRGASARWYACAL